MTAGLKFTQITGGTPAITATVVVTLASQPKIMTQLAYPERQRAEFFINGVVARGNVKFAPIAPSHTDSPTRRLPRTERSLT